MDTVARIGVSLEPELLRQFDKTISEKGYVSRSEALRDLVRDSLAENQWKNEDMVMTGVLVFVFDIDAKDILEKIEGVLTSRKNAVLTTSRIYLDDRNRMDIIVSNGRLKDLKDLVTDMMAIKGVKRGKLTMAAPGTGIMHHIGLRD